MVLLDFIRSAHPPPITRHQAQSHQELPQEDLEVLDKMAISNRQGLDQALSLGWIQAFLNLMGVVEALMKPV